jgi:hypothetical protein
MQISLQARHMHASIMFLPSLLKKNDGWLPVPMMLAGTHNNACMFSYLW